MNKLHSNDINVIVTIQYGIGFGLTEGKIGVETTFLNRIHKSKTVPASRNRINFYEEFIWTIDKNTFKHWREKNEVVKIECFKIPDICNGNRNWRQRIGLVTIKLNEFKIIRRDWDQSLSARSYKLCGTSRNYLFRIILVILDGHKECKQI